METKEMIECVSELAKHTEQPFADFLIRIADRLDSLDRRWKRTVVERDQAREMRERAELLLGQAREEALDLRKDIKAQGDIILELNRDLKRCREALNAQGEYKYLGGDLISREALTDVIESMDWYHVNSKGELVHGATSATGLYRFGDIMSALENAPAVEAEPVVHAHWVIEKRHSVSQNPYMDDNYHAHATCSHCGFVVDSRNASFGYAELKTTKFCSECGAHMDEEVAE